MADQSVSERPASPGSGVAPALSFTERIADPGPLGLAGFAGTTFFLSVINTNMVSGTVVAGVLGLAFFYGGLAQLLAGMWEFTKGNTFGAVAFSSYGAFWLSYWYLVEHVLTNPSFTHAAASDQAHAVGLYLLVWTIFTTYMFIASTRTTGAVAAVFLLLALTFLLLCIGAFASSSTWDKAGGWVGLVTALVAWYASFAAVTNFTFKRTVVPVFPL